MPTSIDSRINWTCPYCEKSGYGSTPKQRKKHLEEHMNNPLKTFQQSELKRFELNFQDWRDSEWFDDVKETLMSSIEKAYALGKEEKEINFTYLSQPPKKWTFEQPKLKVWVEKWSKGKTLNLFAGKTKLNLDEYRVDLSNEFKPDYIGDAFEFVTTTKMKFDTIILDPPYNLRKSREKYNGVYIGSFTKIKNELPKILNKNGIIISLGYSTTGMSKSRGFEKIAICLICHNGDHNDTICVVETNSAIQDVINLLKNK